MDCEAVLPVAVDEVSLFIRADPAGCTVSAGEGAVEVSQERHVCTEQPITLSMHASSFV